MKQLIIVVFLFISIFLVSCSPLTEGKTDTPPFPVVMDTSTFKTEKPDSFYGVEETTWLTTARYRFSYIGVLADTLVANHHLISQISPPVFFIADSTIEKKEENMKKSHLQAYYIDWEDRTKHYAPGLKANVDVRIDTVKKINNSYPVLLTNNANDTITIGHGEFIPLIMEAKDSSGAWRPIEKKFIYMCGNGVGTIILPPKEVVLTFAPVTHGDFPTELRLAYGDNHSSSFRGMIQYRQFKSKFDKAGNYTEEYKQELKEKKQENAN